MSSSFTNPCAVQTQQCTYLIFNISSVSSVSSSTAVKGKKSLSATTNNIGLRISASQVTSSSSRTSSSTKAQVVRSDAKWAIAQLSSISATSFASNVAKPLTPTNAGSHQGFPRSVVPSNNGSQNCPATRSQTSSFSSAITGSSATSTVSARRISTPARLISQAQVSQIRHTN